MAKYLLLILLIVFCSNSALQAQDKQITAEEYISAYKDLAVSEMKRTGIPASITLAQGLLESGNGNSILAKQANNHFGIKCKTGWTGRSINIDDDQPQECFRAYDKAADSYKDHSDFLTGNTRYSSLFELDPADYKGWAKGLKQAGYATNPRYPEMIISTIEKYSLYQYDIGNKKIPQLIVQKTQQPRKNIFGKTIAREVVTRYNNIPVYEIKPGDDYQSVANAQNMMRWEIRRYNDLNLNEILKPGTLIYLKPKRRKAKEEYHIVKEGEGMYYISQLHGMKLRLLYKWNRMEKGEEPATGEKLYLRHKRENPPVIKRAGTIMERRGIMLNNDKQEDNQLQSPQKDTTMQLKQNITEIDGFDANEYGAYKYHIVQPGETIAIISKKYGVSTDKLIDWNNIVGEVKTGVKLYMTKPGNYVENKAGNKENEPVDLPQMKTNESNDYIVSRGETLYAISIKTKVPVDSIIMYNDLKNYALFPGQKLKLKPDYDDIKLQNGDSKSKTYTVVSGETLYSIAKKFHVTVEELITRNNLKDKSIYIGQELKIKD
jgi:LysM repeat protein